MGTSMHETQPEPVRTESTTGYIPPDLAELQNIENGGPVKKADLNSMPTPIRYFAYFFFISAFIMLIIGVVVQVVK